MIKWHNNTFSLSFHQAVGRIRTHVAESKAYRVWNPDTRRVLISRDVIFNEEKIPLSAESNTDYSLIFPEELEGSSVTEMT